VNENIERAQQAINTEEIQTIARILAKYKLGIFIPHMHDEANLEMVDLAPGVVSYERNQIVSFKKQRDPEIGVSQAVGWRWNGLEVEVCSACCTIETGQK